MVLMLLLVLPGSAKKREYHWKSGRVTDISESTGEQTGWLTGDRQTIETWTFKIVGEDGTYAVKDEITVGLLTYHAPLTRTEGETVLYDVDSPFMLINLTPFAKRARIMKLEIIRIRPN
jgi:hypothetical protein